MNASTQRLPKSHFTAHFAVTGGHLHAKCTMGRAPISASRHVQAVACILLIHSTDIQVKQ
jgi:hypothetical protein